MLLWPYQHSPDGKLLLWKKRIWVSLCYCAMCAHHRDQVSWLAYMALVAAIFQAYSSQLRIYLQHILRNWESICSYWGPVYTRVHVQEIVGQKTSFWDSWIPYWTQALNQESDSRKIIGFTKAVLLFITFGTMHKSKTFPSKSMTCRMATITPKWLFIMV